jgi:hypothetical protein
MSAPWSVELDEERPGLDRLLEGLVVQDVQAVVDHGIFRLESCRLKRKQLKCFKAF